MITIKYILENGISLVNPLTDHDRSMLLEENKQANYSYLCLLKEMLSYKHIAPVDILNGWGGIKLVNLDDH